eukprot:834696-Karenia_brevis.AAC.1
MAALKLITLGCKSASSTSMHRQAEKAASLASLSVMAVLKLITLGCKSTASISTQRVSQAEMAMALSSLNSCPHGEVNIFWRTASTALPSCPNTDTQ